MTWQNATPLLDTIDTPADIRRLRADQLRQLADELRRLVRSYQFDEILDTIEARGRN